MFSMDSAANLTEKHWTIKSDVPHLASSFEDRGSLLNARGYVAGRQAFKEETPVGLGFHPRVEDGEDAAVGRRADQAAEPLFQGDDRLRHGVFIEGVAALVVDIFLARGHHRVGRDGERELGDDYARKRLALHVHALPERGSREEHGPLGLSEPVEQSELGTLSLNEGGEVYSIPNALVRLSHGR